MFFKDVFEKHTNTFAELGVNGGIGYAYEFSGTAIQAMNMEAAHQINQYLAKELQKIAPELVA